MQVTLKSPLEFIKKEGLVSFYLEYRNGAWVIVAGDFTQTIKQSEYSKILEAIGKPVSTPSPKKDKKVEDDTVEEGDVVVFTSKKYTKQEAEVVEIINDEKLKVSFEGKTVLIPVSAIISFKKKGS